MASEQLKISKLGKEFNEELKCDWKIFHTIKRGYIVGRI
jgi:hypothetical protein